MACALLLFGLLSVPAQAQTRLIVRDSLGLPGLNLSCLLQDARFCRAWAIPRASSFW